MRAVLEFRYRTINARRAELLRQARDRGVSGDAREAVWIIVRPLIESIDAGEMFVPFLARVSANPRTFAEYLPPEVADSTAGVLREMLPDLMAGMPERARLGREVQLYNSVHSLLAELARGHQRISEAQLNNYVDGWVGMLTAPMSPATSALMGQAAGQGVSCRSTASFLLASKPATLARVPPRIAARSSNGTVVSKFSAMASAVPLKVPSACG